MSSELKKREFSFPSKYQFTIETLLKHHGLKLSQTKEIAKQIKKASDFYTLESQTQTPWSDPMFATSYVVYFFPLNYLRLCAVFNEGNKLGFYNNSEHFVDFGSGTGAVQLALFDTLEKFDCSFTCVETEKNSINIHKQFLNDHFPRAHTQWKHKIQKASNDDSHLICSYSLNELESTPEWIYSFSSLSLLDPSTQKMGRKLLNLRKNLSSKGYSHWAPCTHQQECPLLLESKKDWCHDRIFAQLPDWWREIEHQLPMTNNSVTFSYLLSSRRKSETTTATRIIGDTLKEKGKSRQMICRGKKREFLSWLKKNIATQKIPRGSRILIPENIEIKSNELRAASKIKIL